MIFYKGRSDKPVVVFIHGLGMDGDVWVNPSKSRILAGVFPIKDMLCKKPDPIEFGQCKNKPKYVVPHFTIGKKPNIIQTLFHDLKLKGYTLVVWNQKAPLTTVDFAVFELKEIIKEVKQTTKEGIILIGHSRGGLVARRYLMSKDKSIRCLITISTPHKGSSLAKIARYLSPFASMINPFISDKEKGNFLFAIKKFSKFLKSKALEELLPDSEYIKCLKNSQYNWVRYISVGGSKSTLFKFYKWRWKRKKEGWYLVPYELFSIPHILEKIIPQNHYPEEFKMGKGDGLVSLDSSKIPWSDEHYTFHLNHAEILFDESVRKTILKAIENI